MPLLARRAASATERTLVYFRMNMYIRPPMRLSSSPTLATPGLLAHVLVAKYCDHFLESFVECVKVKPCLRGDLHGPEIDWRHKSARIQQMRSGNHVRLVSFRLLRI